MLEILMKTFINYHNKNMYNISVDHHLISPTLEHRLDSFLIQGMYRIAIIIIGLTAYLVWRNVYLMASERERSLFVRILLFF
jgi:cytochrome c oxidase subunit IV